MKNLGRMLICFGSLSLLLLFILSYSENLLYLYGITAIFIIIGSWIRFESGLSRISKYIPAIAACVLAFFIMLDPSKLTFVSFVEMFFLLMISLLWVKYESRNRMWAASIVSRYYKHKESQEKKE
jgi:hypothetical protein